MELSVPIRLALLWKLAEVLCRRRRAGLDLSVAIQRLSGGHVCLALVRRDTWKPMLLASLGGNGLVVHPVAEPRRRMEDMGWHLEGIQAGLLKEAVNDVADDVEALLGLPPWHGTLAPTTPPLLGIRIIAGVMQRTIFAKEPTVADCGFFDGAESSGTHAWVARFPEVQAKIAEAGEERPRIARAASRVWRIAGARRDRSVLLDLGGGLALTDGGEDERAQLYREYQRNGRRVTPLVDWVIERLEG